MRPYPPHQPPDVFDSNLDGPVYDTPWEYDEVMWVTIRLEEHVRLQALEAQYLSIIKDMPDGHVVEFRADGWTIQHPISCRTGGKSLFDCPQRAANRWARGATPPRVDPCRCRDPRHVKKLDRSPKHAKILQSFLHVSGDVLVIGQQLS